MTLNRTLEALLHIAMTAAACAMIVVALSLFVAVEVEWLTNQHTYAIQRRFK